MILPMDDQLTRIERRLDALQADLMKNGWGEWGQKVLSDIATFEGRLKEVPNRQTCLLMEKEIK